MFGFCPIFLVEGNVQHLQHNLWLMWEVSDKLQHMKRFLVATKRTKATKKELSDQKMTGAAFEARERTVFNGLSGARGPESISSVVVAPKRENGVIETSIFHWVYKVF